MALQPNGSILPSNFGYLVPDAADDETLYVNFVSPVPMEPYNDAPPDDSGQQVTARIHSTLGDYEADFRASFSNQGIGIEITPVAGWSGLVTSLNLWTLYNLWKPWTIGLMVLPTCPRGDINAAINAVNIITINKNLPGHPDPELCRRGAGQSYAEIDAPATEDRNLSAWDIMHGCWSYNRYQRELLAYFTMPLFRAEAVY